LLSKGAGIEDTLLKTNRIPLSDIVVHFRNLNEIWQRSLAVSRSIEEIETPVYEINDKAEQMRENARARLLEASRWTESQKNWPPISVSINDVQRDFEEVDQQRETIRKAQPRALWLVGRLGDISSRYQSIAERARRFSERAEADQNHIHDLEKQIDEAVNLWQFQKNAYSSNTMATANIHRLLGDITQNLEFLKQQSRQGKKGYGQIEQELAFLSAKATNATIPIELDQKIDINGEIRMERNAK
jgi:chromosome segregation ATPase